MRTVTCRKEAFIIENLILDQFGKQFYQTKNLIKVQRRFRLTRITLQDIVTVCGKNAEPKDCLNHLLNEENRIHHHLDGRRLVRFYAMVRHGRFAIRKKGFDPSFFASDEILTFATKAHRYFNRPL